MIADEREANNQSREQEARRTGRKSERAEQVGATAGAAMAAGVDAAEGNVRNIERGVHEAVAEMADQGRRAAGAMGEALALQREAVEETAQDFSAAATSASASAGAVAELGSAWLDWMGRSLQATTDVSQRLFRSWTPKEAAEAQREFAHRIMQDWMERNARILRATEQAAGEALKPLRERVQHKE